MIRHMDRMDWAALTPVRRFVLYGLSVALLACSTGCDALGIGGEEEEPPEIIELDETPMQVELLQFARSDTNNRPRQRVLGRFEAPWRGLPMERARRVPLEFEEGIGLRWDAEKDTDVALFVLLLATEPEWSEEAFVLSPGKTVAYGGAGAFEGTAYLFFVEGIGERPSKPFEVEVIPELDVEKTRRVEIDPKRHVLPDELALRVGSEDLDPQFKAPVSLSIATHNPLRNEYWEEPSKQLPLQPVVAYRHGTYDASAFPHDEWTSAKSWGGSAARLPEDFELYVFMLDLDRES